MAKFNAKIFLFVKVAILFCSLLASLAVGLRKSGEDGTLKHGNDVSPRTGNNDNPGEVTTGEQDGRSVKGQFLRKLQQTHDDDGELNCTLPAIARFPPSLFTEEQREKGAIILNFLFAIYLFGAVGYVCIEYFVPSLEVLSKNLGIQEDVAGATFMAIGSSAPEFFSAALGTLVSHDNTGLGAIVGSAAFNVFIIIALCALFAGGDDGLQLTWYPVIRDSLCWTISMIVLIAVTFDAMVQWWEGLIMTLCFVGYIVLMYYNRPVSAAVMKWSFASKLFPNRTSQEGALIGGDDEMEESAFIDRSNDAGEGTSSPDKSQTQTEYRARSTDQPSSENSETEPTVPSVFRPPDTTRGFTVWLMGLPVIIMLHYTVPDCRKPGVWRRLFMVTFVMSVLWLAVLCYLLYWMTVVIGYTLGVSSTVMGYTVLAIGTSVPDAVASVLVARDGFADMAVANIIGSNIFETLICLGFIWLVASLTSFPIGQPVAIIVDGLTVTAVSLMVFVLFAIVAVHNNQWKLDLKVGVISLFMYILFICWATLNAEGALGSAFSVYLGPTQMPPCPSDSLNL